MDRPPLHSNQAPPARRRIVPVAVTQDEHNDVCNNNDFNQPLVALPAPATGSSKDISKCGPGRRVFVNIDNKVEVKWKDVLRQQGLDITTWRKQRDQKLAQLEAATGGQGAAKRRDVTGLLAKKHQQLYEESDELEDGSDDEDEGDTGDAEEAEAEEGDGGCSSGDHDEEEDDAEDDDEDEKEGNETGGEVDLEKEAEAEQQQAKARRKRQRFERYDDDFIDDSELETVKVAAQAKTKFSGFYVTQGGVETREEASKPRAKPKPRQPKPADAAAAAAAPAGSGPSRKRKQPAQQQQQDQQQQQPEAGGDTAPKKKRQRSETPAGVVAAAAAPSQEPKPTASKKARPSPAPLAAGAAPTASAGAGPSNSAPAAAAAGLPPAPQAAAAAPGGGGTAKLAVAAALAAKKNKAPPAAGSQRGLAASAAVAAAAQAQSPAPPEAEVHKETARQAAEDTSKLRQQLQLEQTVAPAQPAVAPGQDRTAAAAAAVLAATAPTPTKPEPAGSTQADAAANREAADAAAAAAAGGAVASARAVGLPAVVVAAVENLQKAVAEHKPAAPGTTSSAANMSKAVKTVLESLGVIFARQPQQIREQQSAALVSALAPLMLPYMKEKKLKRLLLEEPVKKAEELDSTRAALMTELEQLAGQREGTDGSIDDFQAQLTAAAAEALVAAWAAAKDVPDTQNLLALDVCSKLGWSHVQGSPTKAVAELLPVIRKAKKRLSKHKQHSQPSSDRQSPETSGPAAAAADVAVANVAGGTQGPAAKKHGCSSNPARQLTAQPGMMASIALAEAAGGSSSATNAAAAAAPSALQKQAHKQEKEKEHWSQFGAPSPRLQRCVDAAIAAGADRQWLGDKYAMLKGSYMHQAFRTLCLCGPKGCLAPEFVSRAAEQNLGFSREDGKAVRRAMRQSLQTITMTNMVGVTEADPKAFALLCFRGVQQQPAKASKAAAEAGSGQQTAQAPAE